MAYDVKLNVFTVSLRERNKKNQLYNWEEFFNLSAGKKYEKKFQKFFIEYVKHFDGKFTVYEKWNRGISLGKKSISFASDNEYIIAKIEGGPTDLVGTVKSKSNNEDPGFQVTRDHVNSIDHFFILWLPQKSNKGLLITQSLGDRSIYEPLKLNFKKFVESVNSKFYIDFNEHITADAVKKMREKGAIKKLVLRKSSLPSDFAERVFNKKYNVIDKLNIEIKITGFGNNTAEAIKTFFSGGFPDLLEFDSMKELGIDEKSDILATFEHNDKKATAKLNEIDLAPVYYVDSIDVPLDAYNRPDEVKLKSYLISFLSKMKKEIGYSK